MSARGPSTRCPYPAQDQRAKIDGVRRIKAPQALAPVTDEDVRRTVSEMLSRIEREGMDAVRAYSRQLDDWNPKDFRVEQAAVAAASESVAGDLKEHIGFALEQVEGFARAQRNTLSDLRVETLPGVVLGHRLVPVGSVGAYVPGGRYPLIAAAFMTVAVPKVAGVGRVVAGAPPHAGTGIHPVALHAIARSGADEIICVGGVQAVAMLAFGLGGVAPVDMVVGPGNAYVAEAKRQLFGRVGIDLIAGPSEILVVADEFASPETLALDLLAQAEHGPASRAVLVTWDRAIAEETVRQIELTLPRLATMATAARAWRERGEILLVDNVEEALEIADEMAAEHVHVQAAPDHLDLFRGELRNYGSLFLGETTTVVFGDKAIGTNHCLPTEGAARYSGGLWVGTFLRALSFQEVSRAGARRVAPAAAAIAAAEALDGHARSAAARANGAAAEAAASSRSVTR